MSGAARRTAVPSSLLAAVVLVARALVALPERADPVPTPESVLGFRPGEDGRLADWPQITEYFRRLAAASTRVRTEDVGRTTEGRPFLLVTITSAANQARLEEIRRDNLRLWDPRGLTDDEAERILRRGRAIVSMNYAIHSTEVGSSLTPLVLAHRLATSPAPEIARVLEETVVLLIPSHNPDGTDLVTAWQRGHAGTPFATTTPPALYQKYAGHDNNRDWYMFTQAETLLTVRHVHDRWRPQIVHDVHQMGTKGARLFLPPYLDPVEPNVDPLLVDGVNALGSAMAWTLAGQGKTGIAINAIYDAWTPARAYQHYHGGVRILSEAASANLASPIDVPFDHLATRGRGFNPRERSWNFTNPWPGGRWTLRDIVSYQTDAAYALLENAARYRDVWLANFLTVEGRAVRGWHSWPYAYVLPRQQRDTVGLATLLGILHRGQVEIRTALHPIALGGQRYAAGSYVVVLRQPYAAFAKALLEPQRYPDLRLYPGGPPLPPYDVTAHTLPLLMGVTAVAARDSLRIGLSAPVEPPAATPTYGGAVGPDARRVGLYRSYDAPLDEGWTRWVFDTWHVPYVSIVDSVVRAGKLTERFDVLVLPDQSPNELLSGLPRDYPAPYPGGLGDEGVKALRAFVQEGGTLVALNDASRFAAEQLLLPVRNVLEGVADDEFYAPGSIFRLELDTAQPVARGMPAQSVAWYENGPAFDVLDSSAVRVIGRYPADADKVLLSGWVLHPERVAGRAALVEVKHGAGRVVLFGFRPQYRGQSIATYPLLFNSLQLIKP